MSRRVRGRMIALMSILLWGCASGAGGNSPNLEDLWREWMLAGYFGVWDNGKETAPTGRKDKLHSYPDGAYLTKYGIDIMTMNSWGNGEWHKGGLLARIPLGGLRVELFGKLFAPVRRGGTLIEREQSAEVFLVVRPGSDGYGRLVKHWRFAPPELLLDGDPVDPSVFRRSTRNAVQINRILHPVPGTLRFHFVDAYLDVDEANRTATVTVTGLKRPFAERVDLTPYLDGSQGPPPSAPR